MENHAGGSKQNEERSAIKKKDVVAGKTALVFSEDSNVNNEGEKTHGPKMEKKKGGGATKTESDGEKATIKHGAISMKPRHEQNCGNPKVGSTKKPTDYGIKFGAKKPSDAKKATAHVPRHDMLARKAPGSRLDKKEFGNKAAKDKKGGAPMKKVGDQKSVRIDTTTKDVEKSREVGATDTTEADHNEVEIRETLSDSHLHLELDDIVEEEESRPTSLTVIEEEDDIEIEELESIHDLKYQAEGDSSQDRPQDEAATRPLHVFSSDEIVTVLNGVTHQVMDTVPLPKEHIEDLRKVKLEVMKKIMRKGDRNPDEFVLLYKNSDPMFPTKEEQEKQERVEKLRFREDGCLFSRCLHQ
ncbi:unnamed protein product [Orchesella dallaii]|uniref:Uncharacterized protein n=1 Tax=Orchesella dallaii TaxID=48710 RepID=A0ABP1QKD5_9HEXA